MSEKFFARIKYPVITRSDTIASKLLERILYIGLLVSYFLCVSPTLCNLSRALINLCAPLSSDPADINRQSGRLAYPDVVRVGVSDPSYQCQAVSADSSREQPAAAAHLDSGAVAPWSALQCEQCQTVR